MCDRSEEHGDQPNRFPRIFLKFTVHVIMLVYIAYKILPLVEFILYSSWSRDKRKVLQRNLYCVLKICVLKNLLPK